MHTCNFVTSLVCMSTLICRLVPIAQLKEMLSQQSSLETLQDCFSMRDVMVYGAHRVGRKNSYMEQLKDIILKVGYQYSSARVGGH